MNTLQKLNKIIIKANPSILDLVMGCKFIEDMCEFTVLARELYIGKEDIPYDVFAISENCKQTFASEYIKENCKILGRDITLEDVIIVLSKKADNYKGVEYPNGSYWLGAMILNTISNYKLGKPLHLQSESTLKELYKLIKNNYEITRL